MSTRGILLGAILLAGSLRAQQPERATFYLVVGKDTIVAERMERTAAGLRFQLLDLMRRGRAEFVAAVRPDGLVDSISEAVYPSPSDTAGGVRIAVRFAGDSAYVTRNATSNAVRVGGGALPFTNLSSAVVEQLLMRARAVGGDSVVIPAFLMPGGPVVPATVIRRGADSAIVRIGVAAIQARVSANGRFLAGAVPSQNLTFVRVDGATAALPGRIDYGPPPGAPYTAQEVAIRTPAGLTLRGTLTLPQRGAGARIPAIVTITGSGAEDRDEAIVGLKGYRPFYQVADTLGRRGIAVLRLNDRGAGSDGSPASPTPELADDIRAAVAWLRSRPEIDPRRIGLLGHSEGGIIAPMVAASDPSIAAVVVLAGTASRGREVVAFQQRFAIDSMARLQGQARELALQQSARATDSVARTSAWWAFFLDYDPAPAAARVKAPVLILHGEKDYQVPVAEAERLASAMRSGGNRDVSVRVFPATNHLFVPDGGVGFSYGKLSSLMVRPEVLGAIADWLTSRFSR